MGSARPRRPPFGAREGTVGVRRVVCHAFDQPLGVEDGPEPEAGPGQVVVDVEAAGANFVDALIVQGRYQIRPELPFTPGMEVAGRVRGSGERVLALCWFGGYASQVVVPRVLRGADPRRHLDGAGRHPRAELRHDALRPHPPHVRGAGGVGRRPRRRWRRRPRRRRRREGARVPGRGLRVDDGEARRGPAAGADATVAYEEPGTDLKAAIREATGGGADVVVDPVGGAKAEAALRALRWGGRYVVLGFASGDIPSLPANQVLLNNRTVVGVDWGASTFRDPAGNSALVTELLAMVADGRLRPVEPVAYPLEDVARCLADLEGRRTTGKAVLVP